MKVQLREERKAFTQADLADFLRLSRSTIARWRAGGKLPRPGAAKKGFTIGDVESVLRDRAGNSLPCPQGKAKNEWNEFLRSRLRIVDGGIFLIAPSAKNYRSTCLGVIRRYGLWRGQGLNNHVHLKDYATNPIQQAFLARSAISKWLDEVREMKTEARVVIYWNGARESTICIYLLHEGDDKFLEEYDDSLAMTSCKVTNLTKDSG